MTDDSFKSVTSAQLKLGKVIIVEKVAFANQKALVKELNGERFRMALLDLGVVVNEQLKEVI